ncbi:MAG: glycosyltransferase family 2 protein [Parafilimonas sp.]
MLQLSVIVVNYNVKYFLEQCLRSVLTAINNIEAEILVVDNNSTDNSIVYLKDKFPTVTFIQNDTNLGFSKANNQALKIATGEYILYLNPDTILAEDVLLNCLNFFKANDKAGAIGVKLVDGAGRFLPESKRSFPSPLAALYKLSGMAKLFPKSKIFNRYALGYLDEDKVYEVDILAGAFIMAPKKILDSLKGFDEDFFMYGEDIDLSYRIQKSGYKNYYLGTEAVIHFKGKSTPSTNVTYVRHFYKAMSIFVRKHYTEKNSFLTTIFLQTAIRLSNFIPLIATPVRALRKAFQKTTAKKKLEIVLAGTAEDMQTAEAILNKHNLSYQIQQKEKIQNFDKPDADEIIFCISQLSYKQTILYLQRFKNEYGFKWHGIGTQCIAGSDSKNKNHDVYTFQSC